MIILTDLGYIKNGYDPKNPKNGKKWQKGMAPQKIYPPGVPNQEFAPLEVKNEKTGTVGKSRSLSGQVLFIGKNINNGECIINVINLFQLVKIK